MPLLRYEWVDENKARVSLTHFMPDDPKEGLPDDVKAKGITVKELPEPPEPQRGKSAVLYCNPMTSEVWYEVEDRPLTADEQREQKNEELKQRIEVLEAELSRVSPQFRDTQKKQI